MFTRQSKNHDKEQKDHSIDLYQYNDARHSSHPPVSLTSCNSTNQPSSSPSMRFPDKEHQAGCHSSFMDPARSSDLILPFGASLHERQIFTGSHRPGGMQDCWDFPVRFYQTTGGGTLMEVAGGEASPFC